MFKYRFTLLAISSLIFVYSCKFSDEKKDSVKIGEEKNDQNFKPDILRDEYEFIIEAASESLMEIELGQIAQQNGTSPKIKEFSANMVTDHSKVHEQLKELAKGKNITVPTAPGEKHHARVQKLQQLKGADFDREYIKFMVEDHEEDLMRFHKQATEGKDPETKAFASGQLESLQQHLNMAKAIMNTIKE